MEIDVTANADALAVAVADRVQEAIEEAVSARGAAFIAFSGGETPAPMLAILASRNIAWPRVTIFQVDERVAPDGHDDRNATLLQRQLLDHVAATAHLMPVTDDDLDSAAAHYDALLGGQVFDLVHLGLGPDGHTASLFPGDPLLDVADRDVVVTGEHQGRRRMTLTYPPINRSGRIVWEVAGDDKAEALVAMVEGEDVPAARVSREQAVLLTDRGAGRLLRTSPR